MIKFDRFKFYPLKKKWKLVDLLNSLNEFIKCRSINDDFFINDISSLTNPINDTLIFIEKKNKLDLEHNINSLLIFDDFDNYDHSKSSNKILVNDISKFYSKVINLIFYHEDDIDFYDNFDFIYNSYISELSQIHKSSKINNNCIIGRGVIIGKNCIIKNNVVIKNSIIGDNVIIGDNTSIGTTGFGFDLKNMGANNILPQIGIVCIDDNVRIGSNCTIDRARIDTTYIGKNSMIDNLVHIAHNVHLSNNACIAAQSGISGSTQIGKNLIAGGQSGFSGHLKIGDDVIVAAKSGVTKNIPDKSVVAGFPATDINKWKKMIVKQRKDGHK